MSFSPVCGRYGVYPPLFTLHLQANVKEKHMAPNYTKIHKAVVWMSDGSPLPRQPMKRENPDVQLGPESNPLLLNLDVMCGSI